MTIFTLILIALVISMVGALFYFLKSDGYTIWVDKENVEKAKIFFAETAEKLQLKRIAALTFGEVFKFVEELPSRTARSAWNVRKELMLIMLTSSIFYFADIFGYTVIPYILLGLVVVVIYALRRAGHLKGSEVKKVEEKVDVADYENMDDIQIGLDRAKRFLKKLYDLSIGAILDFAAKIVTRNGRKELLVEQELILIGLISVPYVYFGLTSFKITAIYIIGNYLVEILRGKTETSEELKTEIAELKQKLESEEKEYQVLVSEAQQKTGEAIVKYEALKTEILKITKMTKWKTEVKPALVKMKLKLSERRSGGGGFEVIG